MGFEVGNTEIVSDDLIVKNVHLDDSVTGKGASSSNLPSANNVPNGFVLVVDSTEENDVKWASSLIKQWFFRFG